MAWTDLPNSDLDPESPVITSVMMALRDNPPAIANGDSGAPKIQTGALNQTNGSEAVTQGTMRASAVGRLELKTASVSLSGTVNPNSTLNISLGQPYPFFPMVHCTITSTPKVIMATHSTDGASPDLPRFGLQNTQGLNSGAYDIDFRYIQV